MVAEAERLEVPVALVERQAQLAGPRSGLLCRLLLSPRRHLPLPLPRPERGQMLRRPGLGLGWYSRRRVAT